MTGSGDGRGTGSAAGSGEHPAVLVVGAGPTGLLLAAELRRRDVPCRLIDAKPGPLHWDRATVIHPRSLEVFESLGISEKFLKVGAQQRAIKFHSGGQVLGTMDLSGCGSAYGFNLGMSEETTESILTDYLHQLGEEVIRSSRLVGLESHNDGVLTEIEHDSGRYHLNVRWVVGCDGIHSPTRDLSGIGFVGHDIAQPWAVFDATVQGWTQGFDSTFVYFDMLPVILTALPGRRWRVYMRPSSADSDLLAQAESTIRVYEPDASFVDVENPTRFHCHTKVATQFRSGAVLLAGDAAHVCSPSQGHGMNCGLQDAVNLAWKLALVYHGAAEPTLLDSYEAERRPAAEMVATSGDAAEASLTLTEPAAREARDNTIRADLSEPTARHNEVAAETEMNLNYSASPIVFGDGNLHLAPGQRLPAAIPVWLSDKVPCRLHQLTHRAGHTLVVVSVSRSISPLAELFDSLKDIVAGSPLFEAAIAFSTHPGQADGIGRIESAAAADSLGVDDTTLLAVRPDGYVGLRSDRDHLRALERYSAILKCDQR